MADGPFADPITPARPARPKPVPVPHGTVVQFGPKDRSGPATRSDEWLELEESWTIMRTVLDGTLAMRKAGSRFLIQHEAEPNSAYRNRLSIATLTNVTRDAIDNAVGRPFSEPAVLAESAPEAIVELAENVDLTGSNMTVFARRMFRSALEYGCTHVLADMGTRKGVTLAQNVGIRPYLVMVEAPNLLYVRRERQDDTEVVLEARVYEVEKRKTADGWGDKKHDLVRVLRATSIGPDGEEIPSHFELHEWAGGVWKIVDEGDLVKADGTYWDSIPLRTFRASDDRSEASPFLDLANANILHWNGSSDQRNILKYSRFPMLAASGITSTKDFLDDEDNFVVGPGTLLYSSEPNGKWYYVEPGGAAIESGFKDLDRLVEEMRMMGVDPIVPRSGTAGTATEKTIDEAKARAPLQLWAFEAAHVMTLSMGDMAEWAGHAETRDAIVVNINTKFALGADAQTTNTLIQLRTNRDISRKAIVREMKERHILNAEFDDDLNAQELLDEQLEAFPPDSGETFPGEGEALQ
jgi:hypothetical protein